MIVTLMTISLNIDWLSTGTLIVTFITSCAALLTVIQVKKQRETSYFPELYLGSKLVTIYGQECKNTFLPFKYLTEEKRENDIRKISHEISLDVFNVGFAVAKAVEYSWSFDLNKIIDIINKYNKSDFFHIFWNKTLTIEVPKLGYKYTHIVSNQIRKKNISYVLPSSIEKIPTQISIPASYIDLFILYACISLEIFDSEKTDEIAFKSYNIDFDNFPPLLVVIIYNDLCGKKHTKKFKILPDLTTLNAAYSINSESEEFGSITLVVSEII